MQSNYSSNNTAAGGSNNFSSSIKQSILKVKEMTQPEFYKKRYSKVRDIFNQRGYDLNLVVTEEELIGILDSIGGEPFDREIATQLFEQVPVSEDPNQPEARFYTIQDFVDTHIKAEYLLILQAEETEGETKQISAKVAETKEALKAQANAPASKEATDSLYIEIIEAACDDDSYQPDQGSQFSIIVVFDRYKYETDEVESEGEQFSLQFNRDFHLKVNDPQESIKLLLRDLYRYGNEPDYKELKCTLTLDRFADQQAQPEWYYLYDQQNQITPFKIHAVIQWTHGKTFIPEGTLETLTELQGKLNENKQSIEASLKALVRPFARANAKRNAGESERNVQSSNYASQGVLLS